MGKYFFYEYPIFKKMQERPYGFYSKGVARCLGIKVAVVLAGLISYSAEARAIGKLTEDGMFAITNETLAYDLGLSTGDIGRALKLLKEEGVLISDLRYMPVRRFIKLDKQGFDKLMEKINYFNGTKGVE